MTNQDAFRPDWVSPPGDTILDLIEERSWTRKELADRTGFTPKHINDLLKGRASISGSTAAILARVLGSTPEFWLVREAKYRAAVEERQNEDELKNYAYWLKKLPLSWMVKEGGVQKYSHKGRQVQECLSYFRVASVAAWCEHYEVPQAALRSTKKFKTEPGALAAWLCEAERRALAVDCEAFELATVKTNLDRLRALTLLPEPEDFIPKLVSDAASLGIAVVFMSHPKKCPVAGATRWLAPDRAMVVLSGRYGTADSFWFTFFHELGHILLHSKKGTFVEGIEQIDAELEAEADRFSRDLLIPPNQLDALRRLESRDDVVSFADEIGVAPGIVVGRLQYEKLVPWNSELRDLKLELPKTLGQQQRARTS